MEHFPGGLFALPRYLSPCFPIILPFSFLLKKKKDFLLNKWFYMVCKNDLEQKKEMEHKD